MQSEQPHAPFHVNSKFLEDFMFLWKLLLPVTFAFKYTSVPRIPLAPIYFLPEDPFIPWSEFFLSSALEEGSCSFVRKLYAQLAPHQNLKQEMCFPNT